ncbi:MAG: glycoside hydrolase family 16 protein [Firmicutes bacterium]|nr:glycoside hydrolase family 16 protein [Bacillota bacterium]
MFRKLLISGLVTIISLTVLSCDQSVTTTTTLTSLTTLSETTTTTTETSTTTTLTTCSASYSDYDYESLNYELVFFDEFDKETGTPNLIKWKYQTGDGGWGNDELQYYTDSGNATILNGNLVIAAKKESKGDSLYTSARMNSGRSFLYGKFLVRAMLPQGSGTWPAIWMMPNSSVYGNWPSSGEIDIMEHVGTDMNRVHFSIHTERYYFKIGTQKTAITTIPNVSTEFHDYQVEWLPDKLIFSVDGQVYFTYDPTNYVSCPTYKEWPYDKSFYLILNLAIGGWGGTPYAGFVQEELVIDYVRIYQADNLFS